MAITSDLTWESTFDAERGRLVGLCAHLTGNTHVAEDLAQETLLEAWRHREKLRDVERRRQWLSGIARNVCLRWRQSREGSVSNLHSDCDPSGASSIEGALIDGFDLQAELERHELANVLHQALALLPPATRDLMAQRYLEDASHDVLARRMGLTEGAVRVRLHRGRLQLREVLATNLAEQAASYGLTDPVVDCWRETQLWCPLCGNRRLMGRLDGTEGHFELRCSDCYDATGAYTMYSSSDLFHGLTGYRHAFRQVMQYIRPMYESALQARIVRCPNCELSGARLNLFLPPDVQPNADRTRGMHFSCTVCGDGCSMRLSNFVLYGPRAWQFWSNHRRIRVLPERTVEVDGRPALVLSFAAVQSKARLDAVLSADTYTTLSVHESSDG